MGSPSRLERGRGPARPQRGRKRVGRAQLEAGEPAPVARLPSPVLQSPGAQVGLSGLRLVDRCLPLLLLLRTEDDEDDREEKDDEADDDRRRLGGAGGDVRGGGGRRGRALLGKRKWLEVGKVGCVLSRKRSEDAAETKIDTPWAELEARVAAADVARFEKVEVVPTKTGVHQGIATRATAACPRLRLRDGRLLDRTRGLRHVPRPRYHRFERGREARESGPADRIGSPAPSLPGETPAHRIRRGNDPDGGPHLSAGAPSVSCGVRRRV